MAPSHRQQSAGIKDQLFSEPYRYEFHQAVKLLEQLYPSATHLGEGVNPSSEVISISSRVDYSYPPSDIYSLESQGNKQPVKMQVNFLGLAGVNGPLPMPFTEKLIRCNQGNDYAFQDFLDIFNHRLLSIFHRIRKKYWIGLENCPPEQSHIAHILFSLCGFGLDSFKNRLKVPDRSLLNYSTLLWQQPKSTSGLEALISGYFSISAHVEPWIGTWIPIDEDQQIRLGKAQSELGTTASLGRRFWDQTRTIKLHLGPLSWQEFLSFLPNGPFYGPLHDLMQLYLGPDYQSKVRLNITPEEIPQLKLGQNTHLGWTAWLNSGVGTDNLSVEI